VLTLLFARLYLADSANRAGRLWVVQQEYEKAVGRFAEATVWNPVQASYYESLGLAYEHWANQTHREELLPKAETAFRLSTELSPFDYRYYWNLGRFYNDFSAFSRSFASYDPWGAYRRAVELYPTKRVILQEFERLGTPPRSSPAQVKTPARPA